MTSHLLPGWYICRWLAQQQTSCCLILQTASLEHSSSLQFRGCLPTWTAYDTWTTHKLCREIEQHLFRPSKDSKRNCFCVSLCFTTLYPSVAPSESQVANVAAQRICLATSIVSSPWTAVARDASSWQKVGSHRIHECTGTWNKPCIKNIQGQTILPISN